MKELLKQYAAYNIWATQRILDVILALPEEKQLAEVPSSFNSLYRTDPAVAPALGGIGDVVVLSWRVRTSGRRPIDSPTNVCRRILSALLACDRD